MGLSSGQVIALCRLILASVFLLAIYIDPSQPVTMPEYGYVVLGVYAAISLLLLVVALASWWNDYRLARPVHLLDLATFGAVVFMTEGYTSPFFTFSVFLLLSASIRWSSRETAITALAVNAVFLGAGTLAQVFTPLEIDIQRLTIRGTYLLVLSALFILFAVNTERMRRQGRWQAVATSAAQPAGFVEAALRLVRERTQAGAVTFAWRDVEEPRSHLTMMDGEGSRTRALAVDAIDWALAFGHARAHIFTTAGRRRLWGGPRPVTGSISHEQAKALASEGIASGLAVSVNAGGVEGTLFASGIAGLSTDHLALGSKLADELAQMADEAAHAQVSLEASEAQVRMLLARDLHDSFAQFLAGVSFRLEALKRSGKSATDMRDDLDGFQHELANEQEHLRALIAELRGRAPSGDPVEPASRLPQLLARLEQQWGVIIELACDEDLRVSAAFEMELHQMIREGVANAVRHGKADLVEIRLRQQADGVELSIHDNGSGFDGGDAVALPRSLSERAAALGGVLTVGDGPGTTILLSLPQGCLA